MSKNEENNKKFKKLKFWMAVSACLFLFLATVLLIAWFVILKDANRNTHVRSEATSTEIYKRNFINGFENTENSGKFQYFLPENDVNDLLLDASKEVKDKHIESIYFQYSDVGQHVFYVDLKNTFIKTRVVVTTYVQDFGYDYVNLKIYSAKMGKLDVTKSLMRKGYLSSKFVNKVIEDSHLPFTYNDKDLVLRIDSNACFKTLPETKIANKFFNNALHSKECMIFNPSNLSLTVDFSKLRTETNPTKSEVSTIPSFNEELKTACENSDISSMSIGETKIVYSISESTFTSLMSSSIGNALKEEVSLANKKTTFDLVDVKTTLKEDKVDIRLLYSLNGYLVDGYSELSFFDDGANYFNCAFDLSLSDEFFSGNIGEICKNIQENTGNFFTFSELNDSLEINTFEMNQTLSTSALRNAEKVVEINSATKTIDFKLTKTTI